MNLFVIYLALVFVTEFQVLRSKDYNVNGSMYKFDGAF